MVAPTPYAELFGRPFRLTRNDIYAAQTSVSKSLGKHFLKAGVEYRYTKLTRVDKNDENGRFEFNGDFTRRDPQQGDGSGNWIADFLLGYLLQGTNQTYVDITAASVRQYGSVSLFAQDEWKLGTRATLGGNTQYLNTQFANPFAGRLPGTTINTATVSRSQLLRPFPQFTGITMTLDNRGWSSCHGLEVVLNKRISHGLTGSMNYTLSRQREATDYLNNGFDATPFEDLGSPSGAIDRTHHITATRCSIRSIPATRAGPTPPSPRRSSARSRPTSSTSPGRASSGSHSSSDPALTLRPRPG